MNRNKVTPLHKSPFAFMLSPATLYSAPFLQYLLCSYFTCFFLLPPGPWGQASRTLPHFHISPVTSGQLLHLIWIRHNGWRILTMAGTSWPAWQLFLVWETLTCYWLDWGRFTFFVAENFWLVIWGHFPQWVVCNATLFPFIRQQSQMFCDVN